MMELKTNEVLQSFEENFNRLKNIINNQQGLITDNSLRIERLLKGLDDVTKELSETQENLSGANEQILSLERNVETLKEDLQVANDDNKLLNSENEALKTENKDIKEQNEMLVLEAEESSSLRNTHYSNVRDGQINTCKTLIEILTKLSKTIFESQLTSSKFKAINIHKDKIDEAIAFLESQANIEMSIDKIADSDFSAEIHKWALDSIETLSKLFRVYFFCRIDSIAAEIGQIIDIGSYMNIIEQFMSQLTDLGIEIILPIPFFDKNNPDKYEQFDFSDISQINMNYTNSVAIGKIIEVALIGVRYGNEYKCPKVVSKA